jgi:ankyrin repeat protein/heterokaryon incompatibility protein (HET)
MHRGGDSTGFRRRRGLVSRQMSYHELSRTLPRQRVELSFPRRLRYPIFRLCCDLNAQLEYFVSPRYRNSLTTCAIVLSHTWGPDEEEITYQDLQAGNIKPGIGGFKLDESCKQAKKDGLLYIWNDTCCIDKTNSTELSESINSMFKWYRQADRCYAYLQDVPHDQLHLFPESRWFTRGWTLQELLAPKEVDFFSSEWQPLGSRKELAPQVERATGIPQHCLNGVVDISEASVAQRMSWAAKRRTKRQEDMAYCLLGIFGVTMPMVYGEGEEAFMRLQEEIMRRGADDSILAWGLAHTEGKGHRAIHSTRGVFATTPANFQHCGLVVPSEFSTTSIESVNALGGKLSVRLPLYTTPSGDTFGLLGSHISHDDTQIVGIPLRAVGSKSSNTYVRPQNATAQLFNQAKCAGAANLTINVQKNSEYAATQRRHGFYIMDQTGSGLEIIRAHPRVQWQRGMSTILAALDPETGMVKTQRIWVRLRAKGYTEDLILILDLESPPDKSSAPTSQCSLMVGDLTRLSDWDNETGSNANSAFEIIKYPGSRTIMLSGTHSVLQANVKQERIGAQPMFVVKITTDKTETPQTERPSWDMALRLVWIHNQIFANIKGHDAAFEKQLHANMHLEELAAEGKPLRTQLTDVEDQIRALEAEREQIRSRLTSHETIIAKEAQVVDSMADKLLFFTSQREALQHEWERALPRRTLGAEVDNRLGWLDDIARRLFVDLPTDVEAAHGLSIQESATLPERLLVRAVLHGNPGIATFAMKALGATARSIMLQVQDERPRSLLEIAASEGSAVLVRILVAAELDPEPEAALMCSIAARHGNLEVVKAMYYSWPNLGTKILSLHLTQALEGTRHIPTVKLLLEKGADVNLPGFYPLHIAAKADDAAMFTLLLDSGACITTEDKNNLTPLAVAATYSADCTKILLDRGVSPHSNTSTADFSDTSPIYMAALGGQLRATRLLLDAGADIETQSRNGRRPLHLAATKGHLETVRVICEHPACRTADFPDMRAAAVKAARKAGHQNIVGYLGPYFDEVHSLMSLGEGSQVLIDQFGAVTRFRQHTPEEEVRKRREKMDRSTGERILIVDDRAHQPQTTPEKVRMQWEEADRNPGERPLVMVEEDLRQQNPYEKVRVRLPERTDRNPEIRSIIVDERAERRERGGRDMLPINANPRCAEGEQARRPPSPPTRSTPVFKAFRAAMGRR